MEIKKILVPVDFSEYSDEALVLAVQMARHYQARMTLAHVVVYFPDEFEEEASYQQYQAVMVQRAARAEQKLKQQAGKHAAEGVKVDHVVLHGSSPADALQEYIDSQTFDLVIMGTRGWNRVRQTAQGSVSELTVRRAPIPVMTVQKNSQKNDRIQRILVPVDFSIYSRQALEYAISIAQKYDAKLVLIHVVEQEVYPAFYDDRVESIFEVDQNLTNSVIANLHDFVADLVDGSLVEAFVVREGVAHKEIVSYVNEQSVDLLVIATHGLTGLEYLLLGSTAEKVIRWAVCPVLTIKRID
ncbi:MAG: universal stress protein [Calditrichaeota bacterium]|nr:universal stress protein [Calditrichota bacterium]